MADETEDNKSIWSISTIWFWFCQITSVIGLIGIIDNIKSWWKLFYYCVSWIHIYSPTLARLIELASGNVHLMLQVFRSLYRPYVDWLFKVVGLVPPPPILTDFAIVTVFAGMGYLRLQRWRREAEERLIHRPFEAGLKDEMTKNGVPISEYNDVVHAIYARSMLRQDFLALSDQRRQQLTASLAKIGLMLGPALEAIFSYQDAINFNPISNRIGKHALLSEDIIKGLAIFAAAAVAVDWYRS